MASEKTIKKARARFLAESRGHEYTPTDGKKKKAKQKKPKRKKRRNRKHRPNAKKKAEEMAPILAMGDRKKRYKAYLGTKVWANKRERALKRDNFHCIMCDRKATEVHHMFYPFVLGNEPINGLVSLCRDCHELAHDNFPNKSVNRFKKEMCLERRQALKDLVKEEDRRPKRDFNVVLQQKFKAPPIYVKPHS